MKSKHILALSILSLSSVAAVFIGFSRENLNETLAAGNNFVASDFEIRNYEGGVASDSYVINSDSIISTDNQWFGRWLVTNNQGRYNTALNEDFEPEYTITTSFTGPGLDFYKDQKDQYRGVVIFYIDNNNYLEAICKWNCDTQGDRTRTHEIQEFMLHGKINGDWYRTSADDDAPTEWHDIWVDGNGIAASEKVTLTVSIKPQDTAHDVVTFVANGENGGYADGSQSIYSLSKYCNSIKTSQVRVGLYGSIGDGLTGSQITFDRFEFTNNKDEGKDPYIQEVGERVEYAYKDKEVKLPSYNGTNKRGEILTANRIVYDPNNNPVTLDEKGKFVPTLTGAYHVNVTCVDERYSKVAEPIDYDITVYEKVKITFSSDGSRPEGGSVNQRIYLPHYSYNVDTVAIVEIRDENKNEYQLDADNSFIPLTPGYYYVRVTAANKFFNIYPYEYSFYVSGNKLEDLNSSSNSGIVLSAVLVVVSLSILTIVAVPFIIKKKGEK